MTHLRVGIIGCGLIGDVHARAITACNGTVLSAVCDSTVERASAFAEKYGSPAVYTDYNAMLQSDEIDAVAICTPSGMHKEQAVAAIKASRHVICEKPMALCKADCEEIREALRGTSLLFTVMFQTRAVEDIRYLHDVIQSGALGTLTLCDLYMKYWRDESYFKVSPWRGTFAMDGGGALMNQGIHGVDVMHYLCGAPRLMGAKVKTLVHNIETEDTAVALCEYPSGALGVIEAATTANPGFDRRIEICGSRGYATVIDSSLEKLVIDGKTVVDKQATVAAGTASNPSAMGHAYHLALYDNLIRAYRGEEELYSTADDGYNSVAFVEDVYTLSGKTV